MPMTPHQAHQFQLAVESCAVGYALGKEVHRLAAMIDPDYNRKEMEERIMASQLECVNAVHLALGDQLPETAEQLMAIASRWRAVAGHKPSPSI